MPAADAVTVGELRSVQAQQTELATQLWTGLTDAIEHSSQVLAQGAQLGATEARALANLAMLQLDQYQQGLWNILQNGPNANAALIQQQRDAWISTLADFQRQGDAATEALGRQLAEAAQQSQRGALGAIGGTAIDVAQLGAAFAEAAQTGEWGLVGNAIGSIVGGTVAAAAGAALAGVLAAFFGLALLPAALLTFGLVGLLGFLGDRYLGPIIGDGLNQIGALVADMFGLGIDWLPRRDPLTLDLDGDGIESLGVNQNHPVLFDHDGDGIKNGTGWISSDDGLLVLDRNGNGTIDSGRELFGDSTLLAGGAAAEDGFAALAAEDTDGDGVVTAADARFSQLRVWRDLNQDGVSQSAELFTLDSLGITGIHVASVARNQLLANGNQIADVGTFIRSDGSEGTVGETHGTADVDLVENPFYREFPDHIALAPGVEDLPTMTGSGRVRDLWEAASQSTQLHVLLDQLAHTTSRTGQLALMDQLLLAWANTGGMASMEQRASDNHYGLRWQQIGLATNPGNDFLRAAQYGGGHSSGGGTVVTLTPEQIAANAAWDGILERTRNLFTILEAFNGRYFFSMPEDSFLGARSGFAIATMDDHVGGGSGGTATLISVPVIRLQIAQAQLDALNASYEALRESIYNSLATQTRLQPLIDMIALVPSGMSMTLDFTDLEAELSNRIQQNAVDGMGDLIELDRAMARQLVGTAWNGWALLEDNLRALPITPALQALYDEFGVHIGGSEAQTLNGGAERNILLGSAAGDALNGDGGGDVLFAGAGNDHLSGGEGSDTLLGQDGDDALYGGNGADVLIGGAGNDGLYGGGDDDALRGGLGNDYLVGEAGNDTYHFALGDGQDTINNDDGAADRYDELKLGSGLSAANVRLSLSGSSLLVTVLGSTDSITIQNFFVADRYAVNAITFADGRVWNLALIKDMVRIGTAGADTMQAYERGLGAVYGLDGNDTITGSAYEDRIYGGYGNDVIDGGAGDDIISDGGDVNTLRGGAGNDNILGAGTLEGGTGDDVLSSSNPFSGETYVFNLGDGRDVINEWGYGPVNGYGNTYNDTLRFGAGIAPADIQLTRTGNDLVFRVNATDQVVMRDWFVDSYRYIESVQFADGTIWNETTLRAQAIAPFDATEDADTVLGWDGIDTINGLGGNDVINSYGQNDTLDGGAGDDTIDAGYGNDQVFGGDGNDTLYGNYGNDLVDGGDGNDTISDGGDVNTLRGGAGNDNILGMGTLEGGTGDDVLGSSNAFSGETYVFNLGDGHDLINEWGYGPVNGYGNTYNDTLRFGVGIAPADVQLTRSGNNLVFQVSATDQIAVHDWFLDSHAYLEAVQFADGTVWNETILRAQIPAIFNATEATETVQGWDGIDIINGLGGNDVINGYGQNDTLNGGAGDDTIDAGNGNDQVFGGDGNDTLYGGYGNDLVDGGDGNDTISDGGDVNTLRGGAGNDNLLGMGTLEGGTGDDVLGSSNPFSGETYVFNLGDGHDLINEWGYGPVNGYGNTYNDTLRFGAGIAPENVQLTRSGNNLVFQVSATDQIAVHDWFLDNHAYLESVQFADGTVWNETILRAQIPAIFNATEATETVQGWDGIDIINGLGGNDTINGYGQNDTLNGGAGDDTIDGGYGNDQVFGGDGNDTLYGNYGNDLVDGGDGNDTISDGGDVNTLRGGAGNDSITGTGTLEGGTGDDVLNSSNPFSAETYVFNLGDGHDAINEWGYGPVNGYGNTYNDTLRFGAGITAANVQLTRLGNDLVFSVSATDDITVRDWFVDSYRYIESVQFADGTVWNEAALRALAPVNFNGTEAGETLQGWDGVDAINGLGGNDIINGYGQNDTLDGGAGDDTIDGGYGNDQVFGGDGNDTLNGNYGNDLIDGGAGNDTISDGGDVNTLRGGAGNDSILGTGTLEGGTGDDVLSSSNPFSGETYVFNLGDGHDLINEWGYGPVNGYGNSYNDTLRFGAGIAPANVQLTRSGNNLVFQVSATDQIAVHDWFLDNHAYLESVQFADGTVWNETTLRAQIPAIFNATEAAETVQGWDGIDIINGLGGNDVINSYGQNDTLDGGAGDDTIDAGYGNDQVFGGDGNDTLYGNYGNDLIDGGDGNDTISDGGDVNTLRGGAGNDNILGMGTLEGGTGDDVLGSSNAFSGETYVFNLGDGHDLINEWGYGPVNGYGNTYNDTLRFGVGIAPADVQLTRSGNNLVFQVSATDQIAVHDWFLDSHAYLEAVQFADGTVWNETILRAQIPAIFNATEATETVQGWDGIDIINGLGGNDIINGYGQNDTLSGGAGDDTIDAGYGNDQVFGGDGNDTLYGNYGNDIVDGGDGNDTISDGGDVNTLRGGAGNDNILGMGTLEGGTGDDVLGSSNAFSGETYVFNLGDGHDLINEWGYGPVNGYGNTYNDTLRFGAGIAPENVQLTRSGNNLVFLVSATDQIAVHDWFLDNHAYLESVQFADGTVWNETILRAQIPVTYNATESAETVQGWDGVDIINGLGGNDTINGYGQNDTLNGGVGDDTIDGGYGNDQVFGGDGNDTLYGNYGNDLVDGGDGNDTISDGGDVNTLRGGAGNDSLLGTGTLEGGTGDDVLSSSNPFSGETYVFNLGDGSDVINEWGYGPVNGYGNAYNDTLRFGAGINPADVQLTRSGNDLVFRVSATDQIVSRDWFTDTYHYLESVQFADGTNWDLATTQAKLREGTASADTLVAHATGGTVYGLAGNDRVTGSAANDLLFGGDGNDILQAAAGNDFLEDLTGNNLLDGGSGSDRLTGGAGNELFIGGSGNDTLITGAGADVIAFGRGDGADVLVASSGADNTLSIGGGVEYSDLSFRRSGDDLVLDTGSGDQITLQSWYSSTSNHSVVNLQVIAQAMSSFAAGGADPLLDNDVEQFNFAGLVDRFDEALAANPALTSWALSNALLDFHTGGSDTAAIGGDLAYQYGLNRNLTGIGVTPAQTVINDTQFGSGAQALNPGATVFAGAARLA